jgi:hypothetical protein
MGLANLTNFPGAIAFNARGTVEFGGAPPAVFVIFLGFPGQADLGFRAVTITPLGKTQTWTATSGSNWYKQ